MSGITRLPLVHENAGETKGRVVAGARFSEGMKMGYFQFQIFRDLHCLSYFGSKDVKAFELDCQNRRTLFDCKAFLCLAKLLALTTAVFI
mmetsp:Transcript_31350/g.87931  ORF Transcript_31350/g.87931 Transcript_31350/m.87931 type:complete len:90 (-) Transcript_31350:631-900(-)